MAKKRSQSREDIARKRRVTGDVLGMTFESDLLLTAADRTFLRSRTVRRGFCCVHTQRTACGSIHWLTIYFICVHSPAGDHEVDEDQSRCEENFCSSVMVVVVVATTTTTHLGAPLLVIPTQFPLLASVCPLGWAACKSPCLQFLCLLCPSGTSSQFCAPLVCSSVNIVCLFFLCMCM